MKNKFYVCFVSLLMFLVFTNKSLNAQCDITFCNNPILRADKPLYNTNSNSIDVSNITFGKIGCSETIKQFGIDIYVYQILPNGAKASLCNVIDVAPDNIAGYARIDLGKSDMCNNTFNIGTISLNSSNGFNICDGATYEVELVLFSTNNTAFMNTNKTVFSSLKESEYTTTALGQININITNMFPGNAQPLIISQISDWDSRITGGMAVPCNSDVELYLQGQSLLGNCFPYNDYTVGITSELINTFTYSVNGASPVIIENSGTGANGGQTTGPLQNSNNCYGGIVTSVRPYVFEASNVGNACNNTTVEFKLVTLDVFTNRTKESTFTINYNDNCVNNLSLNNTTLNSGTYRAGQTISSNATLRNNASVNFFAASGVTLNNNFTVNTSNNFSADIGTCQ